MIDLSNESKPGVAQAAQADSLLGNGQFAHERQAWCNGLAGLSQAGEEVNSAAVQQGPFLAGGVGQNVAANLLQRLRTYCCDARRFMTDKDELFTKHLAGQVLCKLNVKQNISGSSKTTHSASAFFTTRSYLVRDALSSTPRSWTAWSAPSKASFRSRARVNEPSSYRFQAQNWFASQQIHE